MMANGADDTGGVNTFVVCVGDTESGTAGGAAPGMPRSTVGVSRGGGRGAGVCGGIALTVVTDGLTGGDCGSGGAVCMGGAAVSGLEGC